MAVQPQPAPFPGMHDITKKMIDAGHARLLQLIGQFEADHIAVEVYTAMEIARLSSEPGFQYP